MVKYDPEREWFDEESGLVIPLGYYPDGSKDYTNIRGHTTSSHWPDISADDRMLGRELKWLKEYEPSKLLDIINSMSEEEADSVAYNHALWARDKQLVDFADPYAITMYMTGRGFGKTFALAVTVKRAVDFYGARKITILTQTSRDIRSVIVPQIMDLYSGNDKTAPRFLGNESAMIWPNGARALMLSAEAGIDSPRGTACDVLLGDECAFYGNNEGIINQALITNRIGMAKAYFMTTPKVTQLMLKWMKQAKDKNQKYIRVINGSTFDNTANLADNYLKNTIAAYEGTTLASVELEGKLMLEDSEALFTQSLIEDAKIKRGELPDIDQYSIGVDPSLTGGQKSKKGRRADSCGIIVSGYSKTTNKFYVIENRTADMSVESWVNTVIRLYDKYSSDAKTKVMIESNAGGSQLLDNAFNTGRSGFSSKITYEFSSQNKMSRALPYALKAQKGDLYFVDSEEMEPLFQELVSYTGTGNSPNAMDAFSISLSGIDPSKASVTIISDFLL